MLLKLPQELISEIFSHSARKDLHNARRSCRTLAKALEAAVFEKVEYTIFGLSMHHLTEISKTPLGEHVKSLVIWVETPFRLLNSFRVSGRIAQEMVAACNAITEFTDYSVHLTAQEMTHMVFDCALAPIIDLPNLRSIRLEHVEPDGYQQTLNGDYAAFVRHFAVVLREFQHRQFAVNATYHLMAALMTPLQSLELCLSHANRDPEKSIFWEGWSVEDTKPMLGQLRRLKIACRLTTNDNQANRDIAVLIQHCNRLQSLSSGQCCAQYRREVNTMFPVITKKVWKSLKEVELGVNMAEEHIVGFLEGHANLQSLTIHGSVFKDLPTFYEAIRQLKQLKSISLCDIVVCFRGDGHDSKIEFRGDLTDSQKGWLLHGKGSESVMKRWTYDGIAARWRL